MNVGKVLHLCRRLGAPWLLLWGARAMLIGTQTTLQRTSGQCSEELKKVPRLASKIAWCCMLYRSIQMNYRLTFFRGGGGVGMDFQLHIQNHAARRTNFHYRDRSLGISAEISHYRYRFSLEFQLISITDGRVQHDYVLGLFI